MMRDANPSGDGPDATRFCERLAERLRTQGVTHPVAAAVALTARGSRGVDVDAFAEGVGVNESQLRSVESGAVAFADVPDEVAIAFACLPTASLFLMADFSARPAPNSRIDQRAASLAPPARSTNGQSATSRADWDS